MTDRTFGQAITELMAERQMSARELSRRTKGMSPGGGTISHFTKGYISPDFETMERVAKALEVPATHFAEYRLERIRRAIDWHPPRAEMASARPRVLKRALREARALDLDV
jgi:transcriptional regulator with XRE-family HTH domain